MLVRDFGVEHIRYQGEDANVARSRSDYAFALANAALRASFSWWAD